MRPIASRGLAMAGVVVTVLAVAATCPAGAQASVPGKAPAQVNPNGPVGGTVPGLTGAAARRAVADAGVHFGEARARAHAGGPATTAPGASATLHADWEMEVPTPGGPIGAMATQSVQPSLRVFHSGEVVYAPTLLPGTGACIEMTTIYVAGKVQVGAWDWCAASPSFEKVATVDATFLSTYTTMVGGQHAYTVKSVLTSASSNTWTSYLYNRTTAKWDVFYSVGGPASRAGSPNGWDMFEIYTNVDPHSGNGYYCADSRGYQFESSGIEWSFTSGSWVATDPGNSDWVPNDSPAPSGYDCPTLSFSVPSHNDDFVVANAPAPTGPIAATAIAGKCVDDFQNSSADGNHIDIFTCNTSGAQKWTVPGDGTLRVFGKCMDVTNGGTADRTKIQLWSCNGSGNQQWVYNAGARSLTNPQSGKCLDDPQATTTNNTQLEIFTCNGTNAQKWVLPS